jgi:hypothetical protein
MRLWHDYLLVLFLALLVTSCATSREIYTPYGRRGYSIDCPAAEVGKCFEKAGDLCGEKGYTVLAKSGELPVTYVTNMIIQCKE